MKKIRVLIVDDSPLFRRFLSDGMGKVDYIQVVGYAGDPVDAEKKIAALNPDVILCDIEMPRMDGITFVRKLMKENPVRVIIVSALNISVFDAIQAGAVDFVRKPSGKTSEANQVFLEEVADKVLVASQAKLRIRTKAPDAATPRSAPGLLKSSSPAAVPNAPKPEVKAVGSGTPVPFGKNRNQVIAIGASTGGTEAVLDVIQEFPENTPGVVVVQHMPPGFTKMYAERLNRICRMEVREAKNGDKVEQGLVLIAPGDFQMTLVKSGGQYSVRCLPGEKVSGHRPSADVLFSSVAQAAGADAVGAILTGMGGDGARGLLEMKKAGAYTIGQDEESCVVYGMPMVAFNMGAVTKQAPLNRIAGLILAQVKR
ncbi:MAG: chemotaxis response regulator protein-glutamate methylesterase [Anaerovoracaceae bacterium]